MVKNALDACPWRLNNVIFIERMRIKKHDIMLLLARSVAQRNYGWLPHINNGKDIADISVKVLLLCSCCGDKRNSNSN